MRNLLIVCCVFVALLCANTAGAADPNAHSWSWEGSYEANDMPDVESGFVWEGWGADPSTMTSVADGICTISTNAPPEPLVPVTMCRWAYYPVDPIDFTTGTYSEDPYQVGFSVEIRAKLISQNGYDVGVANVGITDQRTFEWDGNIYVERIGVMSLISDPPMVGSALVGWPAFDATDDFHVYRMTLRDHPDPNIGRYTTVYVDGGSVPLTGGPQISYRNLNEPCWSANRVLFGEFYCEITGALWHIDYIRWTNAGSIPPPPLPGECGDVNNPYPNYDVTGPEGARDCLVDGYDLRAFVANWLNDTRP